jgi:hypothetical protein
VSTRPLLEAHVEPEDVSELRRRVRELESEIGLARTGLKDARDEIQRLRHQSKSLIGALARLRKDLGPFHQLLRVIFGEIDSLDIEEVDAPQAPGVSSREKQVWDSWKSKLGGSAAKVIDALLLHGEMNTQQVAIAVGLHRTTIPAIIYRLNQAGLINKNGGKFSLKQL